MYPRQTVYWIKHIFVALSVLHISCKRYTILSEYISMDLLFVIIYFVIVLWLNHFWIRLEVCFGVSLLELNKLLNFYSSYSSLRLLSVYALAWFRLYWIVSADTKQFIICSIQVKYRINIFICKHIFLITWKS